MTNICPSIILVHPQLAENVGMAARAMMNCNLPDMRLVSPREDHLSAKAISASSGAEEILHQAKVFNTVQEAIADLQEVYATTARHRNQTKMVYTADKAASQMTTALKQGLKCGLMFGPERTGLENDDVSLCDAIINIPLNPKHCSLNLSQAVLLVGYEFYKQQIDTLDDQFVTNDTTIASNLGTTRKRHGLIPIVRNALISSSTFIVPISAAKLDPARPVAITATISGPSSFNTENAKRSATNNSAP